LFLSFRCCLSHISCLIILWNGRSATSLHNLFVFSSICRFCPAAATCLLEYPTSGIIFILQRNREIRRPCILSLPRQTTAWCPPTSLWLVSAHKKIDPPNTNLPFISKHNAMRKTSLGSSSMSKVGDFFSWSEIDAVGLWTSPRDKPARYAGKAQKGADIVMRNPQK